MLATRGPRAGQAVRCGQAVQQVPAAAAAEIRLQPVSFPPLFAILEEAAKQVPSRKRYRRPARLGRGLLRWCHHRSVTTDSPRAVLTVTGRSKALHEPSSRLQRSRIYNSSKSPYNCQGSLDSSMAPRADRRASMLRAEEAYIEDILYGYGDESWLDGDEDEDMLTDEEVEDAELECGLTTRELMDILSRDITTDDYDTLLKLDDRVPPKTAKAEFISNLRVLSLAEVMALVAASGPPEQCGVCLCPLLEAVDVDPRPQNGSSSSSSSTAAEIIQLPRCGHIFHAKCAREWLGKFGRTCPIDRVEVEDSEDF